MLNDLRYAVRQFVKNPSFTVIAIFPLALGQRMAKDYAGAAVLVPYFLLTLIAILAGILVSPGCGVLMQYVVYGVTPHDPTTIIAVAALLVAVAFLVAWLPARRATCVDSVIALRAE